MALDVRSEETDSADRHSDRELRYWVEQAVLRAGRVSVSGWAFHPHRTIEAVVVAVDGRAEIRLAYGLERADVAEDQGSDRGLFSGFGGSGRVDGEAERISVVFRFEDGGEAEVPVEPQQVEQPGRLGRLGIILRKLPLLLKPNHRHTAKFLLGQIARGNFGTVRAFAAAVVERHLETEAERRLPLLPDALALLVREPKPVAPLPEAVDVIIPVYDGMAFLPRLFDSVLAHTDERHRLIVVDDASPDPRVWSYLHERLGQRPNVLLLRNERNLGFVGSVNAAAARAAGHFVLLNTDVEVPPGWLERLMAPIFARPGEIASTTPFSNAATVCSFPHMNRDNPLFAGLPVDEIDRFFRQAEPTGDWQDLPSGVGFCMGMNSEAVRRIGMFDAKAFGRGYGEENDWCQRALEAGYRNVLVPNLFVYHKHGASFGDGRQHLRDKNLETVKRRHPLYLPMVRRFCDEDPLAPLRAALVALIAGHTSAKPPLLVIDHDRGGGANTYRRRLVDRARTEGRAVFLLLPVRLSNEMRLVVRHGWHDAEFLLAEAADLRALAPVLPIGEIFYNNLVGYADPLAVLRAAVALKEECRARLTVAVHDFLPVCPSYNLLDDTLAYCSVPEPETCRACLPRNALASWLPEVNPANWRQEWREALSAADEILCFSESSRSIMARAYPQYRDRITVRPHESAVTFARKPRTERGAGLNIGVVGGINVQKGRDVVAGLAKVIEETAAAQTRITVIGTVSPPLASRVVTVTGRYEPEELPDLLEHHGVNVCLIPSIWPETFSYVTQELMDLEMPLCCFDLGAPAERVRHYARGRVLRSMDPVAVLEEIKDLAEGISLGKMRETEALRERI